VEGLRPIVEMGPETTSGGGRVGGGGFRAKIDHYFYSGNPKHVFAGIAIISAIFAVPWYFMNRGTLSFSLPLFPPARPLLFGF
jgi:hypothetical protein